jgi:hypothetical protein
MSPEEPPDQEVALGGEGGALAVGEVALLPEEGHPSLLEGKLVSIPAGRRGRGRVPA